MESFGLIAVNWSSFLPVMIALYSHVIADIWEHSNIVATKSMGHNEQLDD